MNNMLRLCYFLQNEEETGERISCFEKCFENSWNSANIETLSKNIKVSANLLLSWFQILVTRQDNIILEWISITKIEIDIR